MDEIVIVCVGGTISEIDVGLIFTLGVVDGRGSVGRARKGTGETVTSVPLLV
jgi:hypothetical protein